MKSDIIHELHTIRKKMNLLNLKIDTFIETEIPDLEWHKEAIDTWVSGDWKIIDQKVAAAPTFKLFFKDQMEGLYGALRDTSFQSMLENTMATANRLNKGKILQTLSKSASEDQEDQIAVLAWKTAEAKPLEDRLVQVLKQGADGSLREIAELCLALDRCGATPGVLIEAVDKIRN